MGISRQQLMAKMGVIRLVDPITHQLYLAEEHELWQRPERLTTSFYISLFPGDDPMACGRSALYDLMNIPSPVPIEPKGRAIMDAGKDIEEQVVRRWGKAGILLSAGVESGDQTRLLDEDCWLSGAVDAILLFPRWNRPHVVEVKTKKDAHIEEMKLGARQADPAHVRQLKTYIGLAHEQSSILWPHLEPVRDGSIYYISRDSPRNTFEFYYEYDPDFMEAGRQRLREWKDSYINGVFPSSEEETKRHPNGWKWTAPPCQWCKHKKTCKADHQAGVKELFESAGIDLARAIRPGYDLAKIREVVLDRWDTGKEKKAA